MSITHTGGGARLGPITHLGINGYVAPTPKFSFTDDFNRANSSTTLGSNWTAISGQIGVNTNEARLNTAGAVVRVADSVHVFNDDQYAQFKSTGLNANTHLLFVRGNTNSGFRVQYSDTVTLRVQYPSFANTGITVVVGDTVKITAVGTEGKIYVNGSNVWTGTIGLVTGNPGFGFGWNSGSATATRVDDFACGEL